MLALRKSVVRVGARKTGDGRSLLGLVSWPVAPASFCAGALLVTLFTFETSQRALADAVA